eukprot:COSAG01_NODE_6409_length_3688_cov_101.987441_2_plen_56_part_00
MRYAACTTLDRFQRVAIYRICLTTALSSAGPPNFHSAPYTSHRRAARYRSFIFHT